MNYHSSPLLLRLLQLSALTLPLFALGCDTGGTPASGDAGLVPCTPQQVALCDLHASCDLVSDVPVCACQPGYEGNGVQCANVDECARRTDDCDDVASCTDTEGGYTCDCAPGFTGDGHTCADVDECVGGAATCDVHATCTNTAGSYDCACSPGYLGDGTTCAIDIATYVADVSDTPIAVGVAGIGSYLADGMGRLAVEVAYTSSPGMDNRVERVPSSWSVHNVVLHNLRPGPSTLGSLQGWSDTTIPTTVTLTLEGLGAEVFVLSLEGTLPVQADTTITDGRMTSLVLSVADVRVAMHTPALPTSGANTATRVEVEGVLCSPLLLPADIDEATPFGSGPLRMRAVGSYTSAGLGNSGAFVSWMDDVRDELDLSGDAARKTLSQVHRDATGSEIDRTNCFEAFPSVLYYFNPLRDYGSSHLIDLEVAVEWCEGA